MSHVILSQISVFNISMKRLNRALIYLVLEKFFYLNFSNKQNFVLFANSKWRKRKVIFELTRYKKID